MMNNLIHIFKQKSPKQRFLFVFGLFMILAYFVLAGIFIGWEAMPVAVAYQSRIYFGVLLIVYGCIRFYRLVKTED